MGQKRILEVANEAITAWLLKNSTIAAPETSLQKLFENFDVLQ